METLNPGGSYPLEEKWKQIRSKIDRAPVPVPTGVTRETYLDAAERIVRTLAAWQNEDGLLVDPFSKNEFYATNRRGQQVLVHAQTRYLGALGHLIAAGRCEDLTDGCVKAYEERLDHLDEVALSPEFWVKEMVYAHRALADRVAPDRLRNWESAWRAHDPWSSYRSASSGKVNNRNGAVFALTSEFFKKRADLGGDDALIEEAIAYLAGDFTPWGMYRDPNDPMTYDLVVKQQLDLIRHYGYEGEHLDWIAEICRRGAFTSLLMQSTTGQMPFGGRSNQFQFMEAHFACLCESRAAFCKRAGDDLLAGVFKRAGRRAVQMTLPWIMDMRPFRHTKQGFHPSLGHGVDSGGPYSVYGALAASLLGTAYHLADEGIEERTTPAEAGGFAFALWPAFHKVIAACGGYHVEVDTRADRHKDSTGLGRLHRDGVRPETALSGSISSEANYSFGMDQPLKSLTIGPAWRDADGAERRLAEFAPEILDVGFTILRETPDGVSFEIRYRGELGGCREVTEIYTLTGRGLTYSACCNPQPPALYILAPVIHSDGDADASVSEGDSGIEVTYRGAVYHITVRQGKTWRFTDDPPAANRNALYRTLEVQDNTVSLALVLV